MMTVVGAVGVVVGDDDVRADFADDSDHSFERHVMFPDRQRLFDGF